MLFRSGDVKGALEYLKEHGQGLSLKKIKDARGKKTLFHIRDTIARQVFRGLAGTLSEIPNFNVNFVVDENMSPDSLGEYDANTNTIYLSQRGLDESTLLHELTHAATVKIIHQYFIDKSKLSPQAVRAVENIIDIAAFAKSNLARNFPNAFENLYEFVAYAMTDMNFQYELSRIQIGRLAKATDIKEEFTAEEREERESGDLVPPSMRGTLWDYFTDTLAWLYKLLTPRPVKKEFFYRLMLAI